MPERSAGTDLETELWDFSICPTRFAAALASASNRSAAVGEAVIRKDEQIADALVISLAVIVRHEFANGCPRRLLSKQNHPFQAGLPYAADEAFGVAVQVRDRGVSFTNSVPASASVERNSAVNSGFRSAAAKPNGQREPV